MTLGQEQEGQGLYADLNERATRLGISAEKLPLFFFEMAVAEEKAKAAAALAAAEEKANAALAAAEGGSPVG
eukprot:CAMPEP_0173415816 /NCGR_PEP_ID=MMETSP1356-20130122/85059_1 /TAXON_ID=77927 ORGANISM="Hemiselmis virescens, Strain PCC157" /NCGR_SAMPLE_ID=MMETSP1356 /ASSEMBLY_ACC=CAM_ASM_000847 /LENGTH=71 /DNA_ID=CAMNT_0014378095 /DNA_START=698 /DNA_END=913 /DNA_ORIENTATION=+